MDRTNFLLCQAGPRGRRAGGTAACLRGAGGDRVAGRRDLRARGRRWAGCALGMRLSGCRGARRRSRRARREPRVRGGARPHAHADRPLRTRRRAPRRHFAAAERHGRSRAAWPGDGADRNGIQIRRPSAQGLSVSAARRRAVSLHGGQPRQRHRSRHARCFTAGHRLAAGELGHCRIPAAPPRLRKFRRPALAPGSFRPIRHRRVRRATRGAPGPRKQRRARRRRTRRRHARNPARPHRRDGKLVRWRQHAAGRGQVEKISLRRGVRRRRDELGSRARPAQTDDRGGAAPDHSDLFHPGRERLQHPPDARNSGRRWRAPAWSFQATVFPPFGITPHEGHLFERDGAHLWAPDVRKFLERYL